MIARLIAAALVTTSAIATAADATLQPTGKWVVDFADSQCFLSRDYGTREEPLLLAFEPYAMGDALRLVILKSGRSAEFVSKPAKLTFGAASQAINTESSAYELSTKKLTRINFTVKRDQFDQLRSANTLGVSVPGTFDRTFALSQFAPALEILEECRRDLVESWGIPREAQARFKNPAEPDATDVGALFSPDDYPTEALQQGASGRVIARILISESGRVAACDVIVSSGNEALDEKTCQVIRRRGRYKPARDVDGKPIKSFDIANVSWTLG